MVGGALALAALAACQPDETDRIAGPFQGPAGNLAIQVSSLNAPVGQRIAVSLFVNSQAFTADPLIGVKGTLRFDPARLEFVGQDLGQVFAIANEQNVASGELVFANLDLAGLNRRTATFAFIVRDAGYAQGISFQPSELVLASIKPSQLRGRIPVVLASDLLVPANPRHLVVADWIRHFNPGIENPGIVEHVAGENVPNLRYGDANLDGAIDLFQDAFLVASVSVGNTPLIASSSSTPNRDVIVAGNPVPFNVGGPGAPGEGTAVGGFQVGHFEVELFDAAAVATDAVNCAGFPVGQCPSGTPGNQPVVGDLVRQAIPGGGLPRVVVNADITTNTTWNAGTVYELGAVIRVRNGATLTIEAGTRIEGQRPPTVSSVFIERDGMIMANGTRTMPIVFTCTGAEATKFRGCWSGFWIAGNARINESNGTNAPNTTRNPTGTCGQNVGEGNGPTFGGCNDTDNSGTLRYVRFEWGGFETTPGSGNELNNLTMGGVGSGTTIEYVQTLNGKDDAFEWFGGTVNARYLVASGNSDDSIDCSFGWSGSVQFAIVQHQPSDGDKGVECDNQNGSNHTALPRTTPVLYNVTIVGEPSPTDAQNENPVNNDSEDAFHIRKGSHPIIRNFLVSGFGRAFRMEQGQTCSYDLASGTDPSRFLIEASVFHDVVFLEETFSAVPTATLPTHDCVGEATFIQTNMTGNTVVTGGTMFLGDRFNSVIPDFRIASGSPAATGGVAAPPGNTFIQSVTYRGAVAPGLGTTVAPWFLGWTKGYAQLTP